MYDLIVIGDDLAAHVSAAVACQKGLQTLLIAEGGLGGLQLIGDFVFNLDPTPLSGWGPDQPGFSILTDLGIEIPETSLNTKNLAYQVILPEHRLDFFNDPVLLVNELAREFPEHGSDINEFYNLAVESSQVFQEWLADHPQIQPQSLKEYFSYLKIFPHIFRYKLGAAQFDKILSQDESMEKVWEAQQALLAANCDDLFSFASAFQYSSGLRGSAVFPQGKQFLFNALVEKLEAHNGLYLSGRQITNININKTIELDLQTPDETITRLSSHNLIISTKSDKLSLVKGNRKYLNFSEWIRPAKIAYYPFTIFMGVAAKCLPEQMARHIALITDVSKDIYDNNLIILETSPPEKDQPLSQSKIPITATVYLPASQEYWTREALQSEGGLIIDRLDKFLPFLKDNIELADIDKSIDISLAYRSVVSPKYKVRNAFFTSFAAKSNQTRFKNVFLTGASLLTDAGFDAEIISGKNAVLQVIKKGK